MQTNPAEEWQRLTEHYRGMFDGELEQLARSIGDLTETAQQVLRNELHNRGLAEPRAKAAASVSREAGNDPAGAAGDSEHEDGPEEFTWKTPLCECDTVEQALAICDALTRAGIENWYEQPGSRMGVWGPRIVVAADQLEEAREIASRPIPQEVIDDLREPAPEYETPTCPGCGTEDPVLESAEPSNNWLCEACGWQWSEPVAAGEG